MPLEADSGPVLGWDDDDLRRTALAFRGVGSHADLDEDLQFRAGVMKLIAKRMASAESEDGPAIFLMLPKPEGDAIAAEDLRYVPVLDNGFTGISGKVWFVSHVVAVGRAHEIEGWDDGDVFTFVTDALQAGDVPAIMFDARPSPAEVRFYPRGLSEPEESVLLQLSGSPIAATEILDAIDVVWQWHLVNPSVHSTSLKLWQNKADHVPASRVEDRIQTILRPGLQGAFLNCEIRPEQPGPSGRLDILIQEVDWTDPNRVILHAVLELKVLRSRSGSSSVSATENENWISDGVEQAASYKADRHAREAVLTCFDMRRPPDSEGCFGHVVDTAAGLEVHLACWPIYATARDYRKAFCNRVLVNAAAAPGN